MKLNESLDHPGFYHVPGYDTIVIREDGKVLDLISNTGLFIHIPNRDHYPSVRVPSLGNKSLHRLLAMTFIPCPGKFSEYQVNHKNGNKKDFSLGNLEWVTVRENIIHACVTGLRPSIRAVELMDLNNGNVKAFQSLKLAAEYLRCNRGTLHKYLNSPDRTYPFQLKWNVRYADEDWVELTKEDIGTVANGQPKPVVVITDHDVTVYESVSHLAYTLGVSDVLVSRWLAGKSKSYMDRNFSVMWLFKYHDALDSVIFLKDNRSKTKRTVVRKPNPILVKNTVTNDITWWTSTTEFANVHGVSRSTVAKAIVGNGGVWRHFHITYPNGKSPTG